MREREREEEGDRWEKDGLDRWLIDISTLARA